MAKKELRWDSMNKDDISLEKLIVQFEAFNRSEGKTSGTLDWYDTSLYLFLNYLRNNGPEPILGKIDAEVVREYILHLQKRTCYNGNLVPSPKSTKLLSPLSIQCYVRAIKAFFNWLFREGYTQEYRLERIKVPKAPKKLVEPLKDSEVATILSCIDSMTDWGARDTAAILLLLDTGLRLNELVTLEMKDLHIEDGYVKVMGKGQKERMVPFGGSAQKALMKYIYHFRPEPLQEDRVFLNLDGRPVTAMALQLVFRRLAKASGVVRLHAHLFRHTFAVNYLMNGGDVFTLQHMLGHTTLEMVRQYVNLANAHVMIQHKRFSPVDRMNLRQISRAVRMTVKKTPPRLDQGRAIYVPGQYHTERIANTSGASR